MLAPVSNCDFSALPMQLSILPSGGKNVLTVSTEGENINVCINPDNIVFACSDKVLRE